MLGFQAYGIEVESILVQESIHLADEFNLNTQFVEGSFVPVGGPELIGNLISANRSESTRWNG